MKITNKNMNKIRMLLVLVNFFEKERPTWPEVIGIYGTNFHDNRHDIHWIMPHKTGFFNKMKVVYFRNVKIYLIPFTRSNNIILKALSTIMYQVRLLIFLFV